MKFPVPKTLSAAITPMLLVNWAFGLGIVEYPIGRPRPLLAAVWSLVNFLFYLSFLRMANLSEVIEFQESKIAANTHRINTYLCGAFIATSMCLSQTRAKVIRDTFPEMKIINDKLKILGIPHDYELVFKGQVIQLIVAFASIFSIMVLDFHYVGFDFPSESSRIGFLLASHYSLVFDFIVDCTFSGSIRYTHNRFQRLNSLIKESDSLEKRETTIAQEPDNQFPRFPSVINEIQRNNSLAIRAADQFWTLYVIRESRKIHRGLCKTAMELNRAFGVQVLCSVALSFGLITTTLYSSYIGGRTPSLDDSLFDVWLSNAIGPIWIMFYAIKIFRIVNTCDNTSCEANRTGRLISKLLDTAACNDDIRDEISIFTLQLIQNPLIFTASGFFPLNYSLIRGMIGSVTTYFIILIQMQSIYESEVTNSLPNSTMLFETNSTN